MSDLRDLVLDEAIAPRIGAASRRQALQALCELIAKPAALDARAVFEAVLLRERLSGTGVGDGVAIPHARIPGIERPIGAFARLDPAQDFAAMDGRACDLVFLLLTPSDRGGDHLKALARVARFFRRAEMREKLREARGVGELQALLSAALQSDAA
jgi:PTS system nitrogen regulatory IIA component